ncbi:MAG: sialidase family protein [Planctomycetota bacterium]
MKSPLPCRQLAGLVLAGIVGISAASAQKLPDTRISGGAAGRSFSRSQSVAVDGFVVHSVFADSLGGADAVHYNRSLDWGESWLSAPVKLNAGLSESSDSPTFAVSGTNVYVVWKQVRDLTSTSDIYFNRSLNRGATWLPQPLRLDSGPPLSGASTIPNVVAAGDRVHVVWVDAGVIRYNRSLDAGTPGTWLAEDIALASGAQPDIGISEDVIHVVAEIGRVVGALRSTDAGATWSGPTTISRGAVGTAELPQLAVLGDSVHVVWADSRDALFDVYVNRSTDGGQSWAAQDTRINSVAGSAGLGARRIVIDPSPSFPGHVYVAWTRTVRTSPYPPYPSSIRLSRSLDDGATWLPTTVRIGQTPTSRNAGCPTLGAFAGTVYVAWDDDRQSSFPPSSDIYFTRSLDSGTTWPSFDVRLNAAVRAQRLVPSMAVSPVGPYVAWRDRRNGSDDIYFTIPLGYQFYGTGKPGTGGFTPGLRGNEPPVHGRGTTLISADGLGGAPGVLLVGGGPSSRVSVPWLGGTLLVAPQLALPIGLSGPSGVPGVGRGLRRIGIPDDPAFVGTNINFQAVYVESAATFGVSMTGGLAMWIG